MRNCVLVVALLALSGCASYQHDPWTRQDTVLQYMVTAAYVIDGVQTSQIQYHPELEEGQPLATWALGRQPSTSDTWQYFATLSISSYLISYYLPARWRPYWQGAQLAIEAKSILSNCAHGLGSICKEDHDHDSN